MNKDDIKNAVKDAEKELKEKQIAEVKKIVLKTLEKIEDVRKAKDTAKKELQELEKKEKILKMDIDDLKEGRLDRIQERQEKDPEAKKISVVIIIKETERIIEREVVRPWYQPYTFYWNNRVDAIGKVFEMGSDYSTITPLLTNTIGGDSSVYNYCQDTSNKNTMFLTGSIAKDNAIGTYVVYNSTVHLR